MEYTKEQKEAIDHKEGNLQIIACAGSGKTDVITRRIALLVKDGVLPGTIVAFTFTDKAAEELRLRIRKHLDELCPGFTDIADMFIGTIHSFCFELLKDFELKYRNYDVLDANKRVSFLANNQNYYGIELNQLDNGKYKNIKKFLESADIVRDEMIDANDLDDVPRFQQCFSKYNHSLDENRYLDFGEMTLRAVNLLKGDENKLKAVSAKYKYIVVDEYQDVNQVQEELVLLLSGTNGNLCVVGDDDQSIYQWRGTNVKNILTFADGYTKVKKIELVKNYRSSEGIIAIANNVIKNNDPNRMPKDMIKPEENPVAYQRGDIYSIFFEDLNDEVNFVINKIEELRGTEFIDSKGNKKPLDYTDFTILFRSVKNSAPEFIEALRKRDIPFVVKGTTNLFDRPEIDLAVRCLAFLSDFNYSNETIDELGLRTRFKQIFEDASMADKFITGIKELKSDFISRDFIDLQGTYHSILSCMGAEEGEFKETQLYNFGVLSQVITDFESVYRFLKKEDVKFFLGFIKGFAEDSYEEGGNDDPTRLNAVKIMTIHQAKGLEFPVVFIPSLIDRRFPAINRSRDYLIPTKLFDEVRYRGSLEDERRLFYVAITRSHKFLFLTGSRNIIGGVQRRKGSAFFSELGENFYIEGLQPDPTMRNKVGIEKLPELINFPTSYSELRYYDMCPFDYKLRFIYGFNPIIVKALGYGKQVHNLLNIIHKKYKGSPLTDKELENIIMDNFYLKYASEPMMNDFLKSATTIIKNYSEKYGKEFNLVLESEKPFEFVIGNGLISGTIDLIKRLDDLGNVQSIEVVDFKTEKKESAVEHTKQLKLYAIACKEGLGLDPQKASIHHLNLDENSKTSVDVSDKALEQTKSEIEEQINRIINREFPKTIGNRCSHCDFKKLCTKKC